MPGQMLQSRLSAVISGEDPVCLSFFNFQFARGQFLSVFCKQYRVNKLFKK